MSFTPREEMAHRDKFGTLGVLLDLGSGDVTLAENVKAISVVAAGDLVYRPSGEASGYITVTNAPVGYCPPHVPGIVRSTANGTTAVVCTVAD